MQAVRNAIFGLVLMFAGGSAAAQSFAELHPDQYFRLRAAKAVDKGRHEAALDDFKRAARYADKPSQLALALAHWNGEGTAADHATAYAWADLAAERGVPAFLAVRERMWEKLDAAERERAVAVGQALEKEYGDRVAQRRLEARLRRGLSQKTGTRTGSYVQSTGVAMIDPAARAYIATRLFNSMQNNVKPGGTLNGSLTGVLANAIISIVRYGDEGYYDPANWRPEVYWQAQDAPWRDLPAGAVTVGPLRKQSAR